MLKPLTLSVGLAIALCAGGVSLAGHKNCTTCGLASPQASPQGVTATAQSGGCESASPCPKKHCFLGGMGKMFKHEKTYTYEWVLKKKRVHGHKGNACSVCGTAVTPSGQYASPQGMGSPQATSIYGASQTASAGVPSVGEIAPANTPDEPPPPPATEPAAEKPAPPTPGTASNGLLFSTPSGE